MPIDRIDHRLALNFLVEIDGIAEAHFTRVTGLEVKREIVEYHEGGENTFTHKFLGRAMQTEIVLERGFVGSDSLFKWLSDSIELNEAVERKSGSIVLLGDEGNEVKRWNFQRAWPVKWKVPQLDSKKNEVMIESLTIAHEGIEVVGE